MTDCRKCELNNNCPGFNECPNMTTTTNPSNFIVKVQASLNTSHDQQQCLIYNQARTLMQEMPMSPELLDAMGGHDKEFFHASFNDGELTIKELAEWQTW
jgi:hypothetical protein